MLALITTDFRNWMMQKKIRQIEESQKRKFKEKKVKTYIPSHFAVICQNDEENKITCKTNFFHIVKLSKNTILHNQSEEYLRENLSTYTYCLLCQKKEKSINFLIWF